jgi:uncharacterized spore protein YtfJ
MEGQFDQVVLTAVKSQEQAMEVMDKLFAVAQPGAVFGEPVESGEYTVITASEVKVGMGFGYGTGGGTGPAAEEETASEGEGEGAGAAAGTGYGGGGGGGGASGGRPVAVISIGPTGVRVEPVVDVTKLGLAFITALGSMLVMRNRMRRFGQK